MLWPGLRPSLHRAPYVGGRTLTWLTVKQPRYEPQKS